METVQELLSWSPTLQSRQSPDPYPEWSFWEESPSPCRILTSFPRFKATTLMLGLHLWRPAWEWVLYPVLFFQSLCGLGRLFSQAELTARLFSRWASWSLQGSELHP